MNIQLVVILILILLNVFLYFKKNSKFEHALNVISAESTPGESTHGESTPRKPTPGESTPRKPTPGESTLGESTPDYKSNVSSPEQTPQEKQSTPGESTPGESTNVSKPTVSSPEQTPQEKHRNGKINAFNALIKKYKSGNFVANIKSSNTPNHTDGVLVYSYNPNNQKLFGNPTFIGYMTNDLGLNEKKLLTDNDITNIVSDLKKYKDKLKVFINISSIGGKFDKNLGIRVILIGKSKFHVEHVFTVNTFIVKMDNEFYEPLTYKYPIKDNKGFMREVFYTIDKFNITLGPSPFEQISSNNGFTDMKNININFVKDFARDSHFEAYYSKYKSWGKTKRILILKSKKYETNKTNKIERYEEEPDWNDVMTIL